MTFNRSGFASGADRIGLVLLLCPGVALALRGVKCELFRRVGSGNRTMAEGDVCVGSEQERRREKKSSAHKATLQGLTKALGPSRGLDQSRGVWLV